ncbi:FGLLP motif-containing membrane protein [Streptomyces violascens]|uniref:FGLLP motif-containing membrane protein n=1 Tax=Streptomyces violascens TaxID=67381 RepID=UPI003650B720
MEKRLWQRSLCVAVGAAAVLPAITGVPDPAAPERMVTTAATAAAVGSAPSASTPGPGPSTPLAGPTPPAPPHIGAPQPSANPVFKVTPTTERGGPVHVNGYDFDCAGKGDGFAGPITLTSSLFPPVKGSTDASGHFHYRYVVPANAAPGTYTVVATCASRPSVSRSGSFQVVVPPPPSPSVSLTPGSGEARSTVNVLGTSFQCGAAASVLWDGTAVASGTASRADWKVRTSFSVPAGAAAGPHKVTVTCQGLPVAGAGEQTTAGGQLTASARFTVTVTAVTPPVSPTPTTPSPSPSSPTPTPVGKSPQESSPGHDKGTGTGTGTHTDPGPSLTPPATPDGTATKPGSPDPTSSHKASGAPGPSPSSSSAPPPGTHPPRDSGTKSSHGIGLVGSLRTPAEVSWALKDLAGSAGLAVWFLFKVLLLEKAFPSQIAENALTRWWRRRRQHTGPARMPGWLRMGCYAVGGGALVVWADATTHWGAQTAVKVAGAAAGMLLILVTYEKTKDSLLRPGRGGVPAELRVVPAGLALAVVMAALSRWLESPVPYVYGLVAVYLVLGAPPRVFGGVPKGQAVLVGGICTLAASLLVWTLGAPLVEAGRDADPGGLSYVLAYTVGLAVVGGVEVVVFGMLPLSGMDGRVLKEWNRPAWYALYLVALTFFFHVLLSQVHPGAGAHLLVSKDLRWVTVVIATGLFVLAWACSLGLRRWVARLERRAAAA